MARPSYLKQVRPSGRWYFQRPIPPDVHPHLSSKARLWSVSLLTDSRTVAEREVIKYIAETDEIIRVVQLRANQKAAIAALPASEKIQLREYGGVAGLKRDVMLDLRSSFYLKHSLGNVDTSLDRRQVQHDALDEEQTVQRIEKLEEIAAPKLALLSKLGWDVPNAPSPEPEIVSLEKVLEHFARASQMPPQTEQQYAYAVRRFTELHGPIALDDLTRSHLREFADIIAGLPAAHKTAAASLTVREAARETKRAGLTTISPPTVTKHVMALKTLTRYAEGAGFTESDPFAGFRVAKARIKGAKAQPHLPFSATDLQAILSALADKYSKESADFWVPIISLYQGARVEEVCQLELTDLGLDEGSGVPYMKITDEGASGKKVKNRASVRCLPIHPELTKLGFPQALFRGRSSGYLFSDLGADQRGRLGGPYGKRFGQFLRKTVGITDTRKVFHSFRHTWTDCARQAGLPEDIRLVLAGRERSGSEAGYGSGYTLQTLLGWLSKINPMGGA